MKKNLYDLTVEEFVRLLCGVEKKYTLVLKTYPMCIGEGSDEITGTYDQLRDIYLDLFAKSDGNKSFKRQLTWIENNLFDYNMELERIDIYNYLEYKTNGFEDTRCHILLGEMEMWEYNLKEEIGCNPVSGEDSCDVFKYGGCEDAFHLLWLNMGDEALTSTSHVSDSLQPTAKDEVEASTILPDEIETTEARKYINKAMELGLIPGARVKGVYGWNGNKKELALFCELLSEACGWTNRKWKVGEQAFGVNGLAQSRQKALADGKFGKNEKAIKNMFKK